jgi:hypothetical protein
MGRGCEGERRLRIRRRERQVRAARESWVEMKGAEGVVASALSWESLVGGIWRRTEISVLVVENG